MHTNHVHDCFGLYCIGTTLSQPLLAAALPQRTRRVVGLCRTLSGTARLATPLPHRRDSSLHLPQSARTSLLTAVSSSYTHSTVPIASARSPLLFEMSEAIIFPPLSPPALPPPLASPPPTAPAPAVSSAITPDAIIRAALAANAAAAPGAPPPIDITALLTSLAALPSVAAAAPAPLAASASVVAPIAAGDPSTAPLTGVSAYSPPHPAAASVTYPPPPPAAAAEDPSLLSDWQAFLQQRAATKQQQQQAQAQQQFDTLSPTSPTPLSPTPPAKRLKRLYPVHNCGVCLLPCLPFPSARRHCTCCACGISVHIECYGISKMSKAHSRALRRRWKCERCKDDETRIEVEGMTGTTEEGGDATAETGTDADCMYCPSNRFALKKASNGRYVHVVCALFLPSLSFTLHHLLPFTATTMEERSKRKHRSFLLVTSVNDIPEQQYELACNLCASPTGLCIQCCDERCTVSYHVTCAMEAGYCVRVLDDDETDGDGRSVGDSVCMRSWCALHRPADWDAESEERGVRWVMEGKRLRRAEQGDELEERDGEWEDVDGMDEEEGGEEAVKEEGE